MSSKDPLGKKLHAQRMRDRREIQHARGAMMRSPRATANVGVNHPDYGLHPKEHMKRKGERA